MKENKGEEAEANLPEVDSNNSNEGNPGQPENNPSERVSFIYLPNAPSIFV